MIFLSIHNSRPGSHSSCNDSLSDTWSHRGVHDSLPENSPEAVLLAARSGFKGVEIDVWFDEDLGLVVSHDRPYIPVGNKIVLLRDIFDADPDQLSFWLDLKNLEVSNAGKVHTLLDQAVQGYKGLEQRIFIESANGWALRRLSRSYPCIYWVQFSRSPVKKFMWITWHKYILLTGRFAGITTDHRYLDDAFRRHFKGFCWYVFTVNDPAEIITLKQYPETRVILTDLPYAE